MGQPHSHLTDLPAKRISVLAEYAGLLLTIVVVILFFMGMALHQVILPRVCGHVYTNLDDRQRRGFLHHHIALSTKFTILLLGAYPTIAVCFGSSTFDTPYSSASSATMGDVLVVLSEMLLGLYVFETLYRVGISPVSILHHCGTLIIGQYAITLSAHFNGTQDAAIEFALCTIWGSFDTLAEMVPSMSIVIYRWKPHAHHLLSRVFLAAAIISLLATITETAVIMFLLASVWQTWSVGFRVATPILHCVFTAAQLWGVWKLFSMYKVHQKKKAEKKGSPHNVMTMLESGNSSGEQSSATLVPGFRQ